MRLLLIPVLLLAGCGGGADGSSSGTASGASVTIDESVEDNACALLTPEGVAEATGAPAGLEGRDLMRGVCSYEWGEDNVTTVAQIDVHRDADRAAQWFSMMTAPQTKGDVREAMGAIGDQLEAQREAGEITDEQADGAGALAGGLGEGAARGHDDEVIASYEPVSGVGEEAAIEEGEKTTEVMGMSVTDYVSTLIVRRGNATFMVTSRIHDASGEIDTQATAAATRALGRAVAARLGS